MPRDTIARQRGGLTAQTGQYIGNFVGPTIGKFASSITKSPVIQQAITQGATNAVTGFGIGTGLSLIGGSSFKEALGNGGQSALMGFGIGTVNGIVSGVQYAHKQNVDSWSGKDLSSKADFTVTPDGVVLPRDAYIPNDLVENPYGRTGSYGKMIDGKFVETLRIYPATASGYKGPNQSHFHLNGGKTHIFNINKWPWMNK